MNKTALFFALLLCIILAACAGQAGQAPADSSMLISEEEIKEKVADLGSQRPVDAAAASKWQIVNNEEACFTFLLPPAWKAESFRETVELEAYHPFFRFGYVLTCPEAAVSIRLYGQLDEYAPELDATGAQEYEHQFKNKMMGKMLLWEGKRVLYTYSAAGRTLVLEADFSSQPDWLSGEEGAQLAQIAESLRSMPPGPGVSVDLNGDGEEEYLSTIAYRASTMPSLGVYKNNEFIGWLHSGTAYSAVQYSIVENSKEQLLIERYTPFRVGNGMWQHNYSYFSWNGTEFILEETDFFMEDNFASIPDGREEESKREDEFLAGREYKLVEVIYQFFS